MSATSSSRSSFHSVRSQPDTQHDPPVPYFSSLPVSSSHTHHERSDEEVSIRVGERIFNCHRAVLAKESKYFEMMFNGHLKESSMSEIITLEQYVSAETFEEILHYIYSGREPEITDENVFPLLRTGVYLLISDDAVEDACTVYIQRRRDFMEVGDILEIFIYSRRMCITSLADHLQEHIMRNFFKFSRSDYFLTELPFDELIQLLTVYQNESAPRGAPFKWNHDQVYFVDILVRLMRRSVSGRRTQSELEQLIKMINFKKVPADFVKFMLKECKLFRSLISTIWRWKEQPCSEALVKKVAHETSDEVINSLLPRYRMVDSAKNPPIHAYIQTSQSMSIYSMSRLEPYWSRSLSRSIPSKFQVGGVNSPSNFFQCFTLPDDESILYSLKSIKSSEGVSQTFQAHSTMDIFSDASIDLAPPSKFLTEVDVCSMKKNIYFHEGHKHSPPIRRRYWHSPFSWFPYTESGKIEDNFFCYNRECDRWVQAPQPDGFLTGDLTADEKLVYLIGGGLSLAYDERACRWFHLPNRGYQKEKPACCTLNGKTYAFDGYVLEVLNLAAGKWHTVAFNKEYCFETHRKSRGQMVAHGNQLWFFFSTFFWDNTVVIYDTISKEFYPNVFLNETVDNDCNEEYALRNVVVYPWVATSVQAP